MSHAPPAHITHSLPHCKHPPPVDMCVTTDEPPLTHHHPESTVHLRVPLGVVHPLGLNKCLMTCIHHHGIIQSTSTTLKSLCFT